MKKVEEHKWEIEFEGGGGYSLRCLDPCPSPPEHAENCPWAPYLNQEKKYTFVDLLSIECSDGCPVFDFNYCCCHEESEHGGGWVKECLEGSFPVNLKGCHEPGSYEYPDDVSFWVEIKPVAELELREKFERDHPNHGLSDILG